MSTACPACGNTLLSVVESAELAGVSVRTIERWIAQGLLPPSGDARPGRFLRSQILTAQKKWGQVPKGKKER